MTDEAFRDDPNLIQRGMRRLIALPIVAKGLSVAGHRMDKPVMGLTDGRVSPSSILTGLPIITLTTTGAKSGQPRAVPLVGIPAGDGRLALIASNWGGTKHPAWYYNIKANPAVTVTHKGESRPYIARETSGEERAALWATAVGLYPGYAAYAARTEGREIPVVVVEAL
jgi:deazaflavin-dependent oxidoreductase (nitroreductase family)